MSPKEQSAGGETSERHVRQAIDVSKLGEIRPNPVSQQTSHNKHPNQPSEPLTTSTTPFKHTKPRTHSFDPSSCLEEEG